MNIEYVNIADLVAAEYNPRKLSKKQHADIRASLEEFGFVDPVVVNQNELRRNVIIGGHQRVKVWWSMGNINVPVFYIDLSLEKEKELNIRLNKNTGEWNFDLLLSEFDRVELAEWGFEDSDFPEGEVDNYPESSSKEIDPENYKLGQKCPKCGFEFDDK